MSDHQDLVPDKSPASAPEAPEAQPQMPAAVMLPEAVVDAINLDIARRFVDEGNEFLHHVVRYVGLLRTCGKPDPTFWAAQKLKETGSRLRPVAEEGCVLIEELRVLFKEDRREEISDLVSSRLSPLMTCIQEMIDGPRLVRAELAGDERRSERECSILSSIASGFTYKAGREPSSVDVKDLVLDICRSRAGIRPSLDNTPIRTYASPDDAAHMFNLVMSAVENAVTNVRNEITGSIGERGAGSEKDYAQHRALLQELCVTCPPLCINAGSTGEIRFNRFFSPDVCACLQTRESELAEALEPVRAIAKFHGGFFGWDIGREGGFTAVLRLPVIVNDPALEEEGDYAIKAVDSRAAIVRSIEDRIMGHILLERSYTTSGGKIKKYEIKTDGAALMSAEAYSRFSSALDYADLLTEIVPELDRLEFSAYGTAGNIADAYQTGCFSVVFAGPFRAPERITLGILGLQLAWEEDKTEAGEAEKKGRGISFDDTERFLKGVRLLRFDEGLFGNKELLAMIGEVCRRAEPVQLSLDFDIEAQKLILPDLCRVLDEVQALHPGERLGLHLCRIDYVDGACGDAILSLQVLDRTGGIIAKGSLSRTTKSFAYGTHDPVLTSRAEDRIIAAVKSAQAQGEITFRKLDRKLEENGLELPEDLVMDLVKESARFAAMEEPDAALAWYVDMRLNRQELQTTEEGGRIKVTKPVS